MDPSYNNSFDSSAQNNVGAPISSGTGDIVLGGASEKKQKKWPIVIVVLLLMVVIGLVVAYFVFKPGGSSSNTNVSEYKTDFNKYANYVIYGEEDSTVVSTDLDPMETYYFDKQISSGDLNDKTTVVNKAGELFDNFLTKYEGGVKTEKSPDDVLDTYVAETGELIDFMKIVYSKDEITVDMISQFYLANGGEQALVNVTDYYDFGELVNNSFAEDFSETLDTLAGLIVDELDTYRIAGCLVDGVMPDECLLQSAGQESVNSVNELKTEIDELASEVNVYYNLSSNLVLKTLVMNAVINGGDISNYVMVGNDDE